LFYYKKPSSLKNREKRQISEKQTDYQCFTFS